MITHDEAREKMDKIAETTVYHFPSYDEDGFCNDDDYDEYPVDEELIKVMAEYISQQEKLQAEHETLKRDVARYFETRNRLKIKTVTEDDIAILHALEEKLSKVGKEEWHTTAWNLRF